jgi:hypothetical protein
MPYNNGKHIMWGHSYPALNSALQEREFLEYGDNRTMAQIDPDHVVVNHRNVAHHIDDLVLAMLRRAQRMVGAADTKEGGVEAINTLIIKYREDAIRSTKEPEYATPDRKRPPKRNGVAVMTAGGRDPAPAQDDEIVVSID